jgi:hypothetical protein
MLPQITSIHPLLSPLIFGSINIVGVYVIVDKTVRNFKHLLTIKNITSMERVGALIHKLKEQYDQNVDKKNLLATVQLLLAELEQATAGNASKGKVSVILPKVHRISQDVPDVEAATVKDTRPDAPQPDREKPAEAVPDIPETIRSYVLKPPSQAAQPAAPSKPPAKKEDQSGWLFDPVSEVPTLAHQKEVYELNDVHIDGDSLNDKLKEDKTELGTTIKSDVVNDLRRAIGINDRYRFINELFRGDEDMYERSIKTINSFGGLPEAQTWIQRELKVKIGWNEGNQTVKDFDQVVKRRFS